jgi:septal ring factor EnvC (AmiA/AmiB activator)
MAIEPMDDMPKITLERDDLESFQRTRGQSNKPNSNKNKTPGDTKSAASGSPFWIVFILVMGIVIAAGTYWSIQQQKTFSLAQERISQLERRLSATGEELDQSAVALQVKVTELSKKTEDLWEQMDKLWASAWRRNQAEIADLNSELQKLKSSYDKKITSLIDSNEQQDTSVVSLNNQLTQLNQNLKVNQETQELLKRTIQSNEQQLTSLREKIISSALGNNNLTNKVEELNSKLTNLEKSLNKIPPAQSSPL